MGVVFSSLIPDVKALWVLWVFEAFWVVWLFDFWGVNAFPLVVTTLQLSLLHPLAVAMVKLLLGHRVGQEEQQEGGQGTRCPVPPGDVGVPWQSH